MIWSLMNNNIVFTCFVLVVFQDGEVLYQVSAVSPAIHLVPPDKEIVLPPGGVFTRQCRSETPVRWIYNSLDTNVASRVKVNTQQNSDNEYVATIEVNSVSYLDVGYKYCVHDDTSFDQDSGGGDIMGSSAHSSRVDNSVCTRQNVTAAVISGGDSDDDDDGTASVYMYVDDSEHLLVSRDPIIVTNVKELRRSVIKCKPTHPDVAVSIVYALTTDEFTNSMRYDPHEGFVILKGQLQLHTAKARMICHAERGSVTKEIDIFLNFIRHTDSVGAPYISRIDDSHIIEGDKVELECRVVDNLAVRVTISWSVPGASTGLKTGRIFQQPQEKSRGLVSASAAAESDLVVRRLVIDNALTEDSGNFECKVEDHNGNTNNVFECLIVHDKNEANIDLFASEQQHTSTVGETVTLSALIDAFPDPNITWLLPGSIAISSRLSHRYQVFVSKEETRLTIVDIAVSDTGVYQLQARAPNNNVKNSLQFNITVLDQARVHVATKYQLVLIDSQFTIHCGVTGNPLPRVWWTFKKCHDNSTCVSTIETLLTKNGDNSESETQTTVSSYMMESVLQLNYVRHSGVYTCHADNGHVPPASGSYILSVTDMKNGFGVRPSHSPVVSGDSLFLHCIASKIVYTQPDQISWYQRSSIDNTTLQSPLNRTDEVTVTKNETNNSYITSLHWSNISHDSSAVYVCVGSSINDTVNSTNFQLDVLEPEIPKFTAVSNMDMSAHVQVQQGEHIILNCSVSALPAPKIRWFKDGVEISVNTDPDERVRVTDSSRQHLYISAALAVDSGDYECEAVNRAGMVRGTLYALVLRDGLSVTVTVVIVVVMLAVFLPLAAALVWKIKKQKELQRRLTVKEMETFTNGLMQQYNPQLSFDEQAELLPYDENWEFAREKLILGRQIGSGAFGRVVRAEAVGLHSHELSTVVAVKMPRSGSDPDQIRSLMAELKIMIQLGRHLNVVNLLGAVTKHAINGDFMVMVEYCRYGNLHHYLLKYKNSFVSQLNPTTGEYDSHLGEELFNSIISDDTDENHYKSPRVCGDTTSLTDTTVGTTACLIDNTADTSFSPNANDNEAVDSDCRTVSNATISRSRKGRVIPVTTRDLLRWSYQISSGMQYLASRKLLHGDLAARNILLADNSIVKISDFGLSRDIYKTRDYKKTTKGPLPVKWMAIESIQYSVFSSQSDVWAFGVVLWEMFSLGAAPYPGMEYDVNFVRRLRGGYRMDQPTYCPNSVYQLMLRCWHDTPGDRPTFDELSRLLGELLEDGVIQEFEKLRKPFEEENARYLTDRAIYINQLVVGDYQNVDQPTDNFLTPAGGNEERSYVNVDSKQQQAVFSNNNTSSTEEAIPADNNTLSSDQNDYLVPSTSI